MNLPSRYKPTGQAFSGGQGVVTIWADTWLDRKVAVKVLATSGIGGSLRNEAALLAAIRSKHVVELFEINQDPSSSKDYLIMEFVDGGDLDRYTPKDSKDLLLTLFQIASGVADIHVANCVHRDLKPQNLKRDQADVIKIIDFGIGGPNPVNTSSGRGTDGYRAPEFFSIPITIGQPADVYALGVIAHEFCFGSIHPHLYQYPPSPPPSLASARIGSAKSRLPEEVVQVLDKCLLPNASERPTAANVKLVLAKHLLKNQHIAEFFFNNKIHSASRSSPQFQISASNGSFKVSYTGVDFIVSDITGDVFVNGVKAVNGMTLPNSCVIGIGTDQDRAFIPFNVSHPEVVL
jgi:eukaryotic-like serine/threonine-protein kinase